MPVNDAEAKKLLRLKIKHIHTYLILFKRTLDVSNITVISLNVYQCLTEVASTILRLMDS